MTGTFKLVFSAAAASVAAAAALAANPAASLSPIPVQESVPEEAGAAVLQPFVSYSIEFAFFPDYAGSYPCVPGDITLGLLLNSAVQGTNRIRITSRTSCWRI